MLFHQTERISDEIDSLYSTLFQHSSFRILSRPIQSKRNDITEPINTFILACNDCERIPFDCWFKFTIPDKINDFLDIRVRTPYNSSASIRTSIRTITNIGKFFQSKQILQPEVDSFLRYPSFTKNVFETVVLDNDFRGSG